MDTILPSQPEPYSILLKRSLILYFRGFSKAIIFSLLLALVIFTPRLFADITGRDIFLGISGTNPRRLWLFVFDIISMLFSIAIYWHLFCVLRNKDEPLAEDFARGIKKVLHVFLATLIQGIILLAVTVVIYGILFLLYQYRVFHLESVSQMNIWRTLFLMVILLSQLFLIMYVTTLFVFIVPIIVIENNGVLPALEKSASLVWNHWWRTFSLQITPWFFYLITLLVIRFIIRINIHIYFFEQGTHTILTTIMNILIFALFIPWIASAVIVQLRDLELRKEIHNQLHEAKLKHKST